MVNVDWHITVYFQQNSLHALRNQLAALSAIIVYHAKPKIHTYNWVFGASKKIQHDLSF